MNFGIVVFPGTWSDADFQHAIQLFPHTSTRLIWHTETNLANLDAIILPGGFSFGDHLRAGAIANFSPVMEPIKRFAHDGGTVLGSCNGFQTLCESGLLPGVLIRNNNLQFRCQWTHLRTENHSTRFTSHIKPGTTLRIPISHGEGNYQASPHTIAQLEEEERIIFRYASPQGQATDEFNPNGSINNIAGIVNEGRNVLGLMPHPERACEELLGSTDGNPILQSMIHAFGAAAAATP